MATTPEPSAKVAVIPGAGSGIGRAVARLTPADGYRVVLAPGSSTARDRQVQDAVPCEVSAR